MTRQFVAAQVTQKAIYQDAQQPQHHSSERDPHHVVNGDVETRHRRQEREDPRRHERGDKRLGQLIQRAEVEPGTIHTCLPTEEEKNAQAEHVVAECHRVPQQSEAGEDHHVCHGEQ